MTELKIRRVFPGQLSTGAAAVFLCFIITLIYWPIYGTITKAIISAAAGPVLGQVEPAVSAKYISVFTEGVFFWTCINAWVWQLLIFAGHGKYTRTKKQPAAGFRYAGFSLLIGIVAFLALVGIVGLWWKPFSFAILFTPQNAQELSLAIEGWEASNFFCLAVLIGQIPFSSLFQRKPFAGRISSPYDGMGVMGMSLSAALITWVAIFIPSFFRLQIGTEAIISAPFGSWPNTLAFCQGFIFWFLIPAEGGEQYPMKLFTKKQPWMGVAGLAIALIFGGWLTPMLLGKLVVALQLLPNLPTGTVVASLELSCVVFMLTWHHLFDDYPSAAKVKSDGKRVLTRFVIWVVGGLIYGLIWLRVYTLLPYGANNMGLGYPTMGILAGQFAFLMVVLYMNTVFDKFPLVIKEEVPVQEASRS
ncbi:hypothetical protein SDC9_93806 [bioreactor metagenome]|uniref:AAT family amino acid transporter n=1 Tax=bioreactor metagenome TaxID=1076179 RepID=A0A645A2Z3_9ZZZZ